MVAGITYFLKPTKLVSRNILAGITSSVGVIFWNSLIEINRVSQYLNVDIPFRLFPISFADAGDSVVVFALTALTLGLSVDKKAPAAQVIWVAGVAAIVTLLADVYCF